jgi:hypothetical protein
MIRREIPYTQCSGWVPNLTIGLNLRYQGDNRPISLSRAIAKQLDVARVKGELYYLSAAFLTVSGCDSRSH